MREIEKRRAKGIKGRLTVKITRDQLMTWVEDFVRDFSKKRVNRVDQHHPPLPYKSRTEFFFPGQDRF